MTIEKINYYGLVHEEVIKRFAGELSFVNTFCVNGEYLPVSVYRAAKPDKKKGHKRYMLLHLMEGGSGLVRGMTPAEIRPFRKHDAVHCLKCDTVIFSAMRHDMHYCPCGNVSVDGGSDYLRSSFKDASLMNTVLLDLLTDKIVITPIVKSKKDA